MATFLQGNVFTLTRPDGIQSELRGWGDQCHAVCRTLGGYIVMEIPGTGVCETAHLRSRRPRCG